MDVYAWERGGSGGSVTVNIISQWLQRLYFTVAESCWSVIIASPRKRPRNGEPLGIDADFCAFQVKIPGIGHHYREAGRLWLRIKDNDSVGQRLLLALYFSSSSSPHIPVMKPFSPSMRKLHCRWVWAAVWGGSMWSGSSTASPLTDDRLWRLAGENLHRAAVLEKFVLLCNHPLPLSPTHTETWAPRRLCVFISRLDTKQFSSLVLFLL